MVLEIIVYYTESLVFEITKGAFLFHPLSMTNDGEYLLLRFSFRMIFVSCGYDCFNWKFDRSNIRRCNNAHMCYALELIRSVIYYYFPQL